MWQLLVPRLLILEGGCYWVAGEMLDQCVDALARSGVFCLVLHSLPLAHGECDHTATVLLVKLLEKVSVYV